MSKFLLTMNMPSQKGNAIHQIIAGHPSETLEQFTEYLEAHEFVVVDEFYYDAEDKQKLFLHGRIALNYRVVGKVKMI